MAQIKTQDISVGVGGSEFVPETPRQAVGTGPARLANLVDTGLQGFKAYKKHTAESEAKSLLEKFTGYERKAALIGEEDELIDREMELQKTMDNAKGGTPAFALSRNEMAQVKRARDQLEKKRDAVDQGLLSYEQYRRDAETLFYQQVAMTPGLKDELAGAMSEYLGIDPRGQTAAIEMEKRKAQLKQGRDTLSTMRTSMQKLGLWDEFRTEEENFQMYSTTFKQRARAIGDLELQKKQLESVTALSNAQQKVSATEINKSLVEAQPQALASMSFFGQYNANTMSASDFVNLPEEDRLNWRAALQQQRDQFASVGNNFKAMLGDHFDPAPHQAAIDARFELIDGLLSGKQKEDVIAQRLKMLQDENNYSLEFEKNGILMDNTTARRLAAISDLIPGEVLAKDITASNIVAELLMGRSQDLVESVDPAKRDNTLQAYQWTLQNMTKGWDIRKDWDDNHVKESGQILVGVSRHLPDELDHATRQQMFRLAANTDFMSRLAQVDPRKHSILSKNLLEHQTVHNDGVRVKLERSIQTHGATATPDNFFLKKEDDIWMLVPTSAALEPVDAPELGGVGFARGRRGTLGAASKAQTANIASLGQVTASMNNARGAQWNSLVKARANALSISEAEAARQLSVDIGLSSKDVTPKADATPDKPGFGDDLKKDKDAKVKIDPTVAAIKELADEVPGATYQEIQAFLKEIQQNRPRPGDPDFDANALSPSQ